MKVLDEFLTFGIKYEYINPLVYLDKKNGDGLAGNLKFFIYFVINCVSCVYFVGSWWCIYWSSCLLYSQIPAPTVCRNCASSQRNSKGNSTCSWNSDKLPSQGRTAFWIVQWCSCKKPSFFSINYHIDEFYECFSLDPNVQARKYFVVT